MTLPAVLFGLVVSLLASALFHAVRGGSGWRLLLYLGLSLLGFMLGQAVVIWLFFVFFKFGALDLGMGMIGSVLFMAVGAWLVRQ